LSVVIVNSSDAEPLVWATAKVEWQRRIGRYVCCLRVGIVQNAGNRPHGRWVGSDAVQHED
jgi:hypothetical protein